jgi:hypothetical protein
MNYENSIKKTRKSIKNKTGYFICYSYEVFICVIRKVSNEAFLSFAGIGPYHVSENNEKAIEEANQYFPSKPKAEEDEQNNNDGQPAADEPTN